jgi:CpeT/CpcT family (DUF1001)
MFKTRFCLFFALLCGAAPVFSQKTDLESDLRILLEWFTGEFNNFQQTYQEKEDSVKADLRHEHIHSIFAPIAVPVLGANTFFVKQYMDGDESKVYRERIYRFSINKQEKAVQLDIYSFADPADEKRYAMAYLDADALKGLTMEQIKPAPGCEVYWKRDGERFVGYMKERACNFVSKRSGKRIYITDSLQLTKESIWISDEAVDEDGNYVFGNKAHIPHKLQRCHYFKGWAAVRKAEPEQGYHGIYNLKLHNQGQRVRLALPGGETTPYWVELAQVIYGKKLTVLKLAVYEDGVEKSLGYVWASPDARNIGINMRIMQAGFTFER